MEKHFCLDDSSTILDAGASRCAFDAQYRMIELDEVDSTNNYLRHLETTDDHRMTLVTAEFQTAGRGAGTNHWESTRGENLLLSLCIHPTNLPARRMFAISEATALAVHDSLTLTLSQEGGTSSRQLTHPLEGRKKAFSVKWPNDIYYADYKVAGMLIENDLQGARVLRSTIGIGININQRRFLSDAPNPRSLADIVGHDIERQLVLKQFIDRFTHYFEQIETGQEDALDALHENYKSRLYRFSEEHIYSDKDGTFRATITDVEPSGHLILRDTQGILRRYAFKEVSFSLLTSQKPLTPL